MGNIDYSKVLIGGLVAGIVFFALDFLGYMIMGMDMDAWLARHSLHEPPMWVFIVMDILYGMLIVWLYAAIRPRFGPGPKTAAIAAAFTWLFFALTYFGLHMMGLFTQGDYMMMAAWGFVMALGAAMAGAWVYKESEGAGAPRM
ncbi:hypothetical protein BH23GEM1_BH23GEM1_02230 [soil metagenome]